MTPKVQQILDRREEVATHQKHLKDLEANLSTEERKELSDAEKESSPKKPAPSGA